MSYLIVGCGLSGATVAERISTILNEKVVIIDKRDHIAGNCYDYIDDETGILINKYGAHLFHTNNEEVWQYISKFSEWVRWEHKVLSYIDNKYVSVPVNITTVNEICGTNISDSNEMKKWLDDNQIKFKEKIKNSEEMALSRVGKNLYEKMFLPYTIKQWNKHPTELDESVLARIPVRYDFDTRYFSDKYQYLPKNGYTELVKKMINNSNIELILNMDYNNYKLKYDISKFKGIIFTGAIDSYFENVNLPKLEYRSIDFKIERLPISGFFQPNSVVNYPCLDVDFTRIIEYKDFLNQKSNNTLIVKEFPSDEGEPYYPVPNKINLELYEQYRKIAKNDENTKKVYFLGRLANYKYYNMDETIYNSLKFFKETLYCLCN